MKKIMLLLLLPTTAFCTETLCPKDQITAFSCALKNGKTVSICASPDLDEQKGSLTYLFGKPSKIELTYPEHAIHPSKVFKRDYVKYGFHNYIAFYRKKVRYAVYGNEEDDWKGDGVMVNSRIMNCKTKPSKDKFSEILDKAALPDDSQGNFK